MPPAQRLLASYHGTRDGQPFDDLNQIAAIGLLKAIDRFDPSRGTGFLSCATPTITGELKRHCRATGAGALR